MKWLVMLAACCMTSVGFADGNDNSNASGGNSCSNDNPYLQQMCQNMQQVAEKNKQANEDAYNKAVTEAKKQEAASQPQPPPPPPEPAWQQAITPSAPAAVQNSTATANTNAPSNTNTTTTTTNTPPPPPPGPAETAGPAPIAGPGGLVIVPVKKQQNSGAMYY